MTEEQKQKRKEYNKQYNAQRGVTKKAKKVWTHRDIIFGDYADEPTLWPGEGLK